MYKKLFLPFLCIALFSANALHAQDFFGKFYELTPEEEELLAAQAASASGNASPEEAIMASSSSIDWTREIFSSNVSLDVVKAKIPMPSGKTSAINRIQMQLPVLIKDPLLSIYVDDSLTLSDLVLQGTVTLEELTRIITSSHQSPAVFSNGGTVLQTRQSIRLQDIGSLIVRHHMPYTQEQPIERIASREYSGIIIDARGKLPVHGEFITSQAKPCLFPKIYDDQMTLVYERNMVDPAVAKSKGIVLYGSDQRPLQYKERVGNDPLWITAKKIYGVNRVDPVISHDDFLRIVTVPSNLALLQQGRVVILLDEAQLSYAVSAPERNRRYYLAYEHMQKYLYENKVPDVVQLDTPNGLKLIMQNLRFIADSAELLPEERSRVKQIAQSIKELNLDFEHTILVEGHTADVNKPNGQLTLSVQRAETIVNALVAEGLERSLFTYKGYGGTVPVADNSTSEGRAQNRRVEITVAPKASFTQRTAN